MISSALLSELKQIVLEEYGVTLTDNEISLMGELLIDSYDILLDASDENEMEGQR